MHWEFLEDSGDVLSSLYKNYFSKNIKLSIKEVQPNIIDLKILQTKIYKMASTYVWVVF